MKKRLAVLVLVLCAVLGWMTAAQADPITDFTILKSTLESATSGTVVDFKGEITEAFSVPAGVTLCIQSGSTVAETVAESPTNITIMISSGATLQIDADLSAYSKLNITNNGTLEGSGKVTTVKNTKTGTVKGSLTITKALQSCNGILTDNITVECEITNAGTISGGTFNGKVKNDGGTVTAGTFNADVENKGVITGGTFAATCKVENNNIIKGGTFKGTVENYKYIWGGTFEGSVVNKKTGMLSINKETNQKGTYKGNVTNDGTIYDGIFEASSVVTNKGTIASTAVDKDGKPTFSEFKGEVIISDGSKTSEDYIILTLHTTTDASDSEQKGYFGTDSDKTIYTMLIQKGATVKTTDLPTPKAIGEGQTFSNKWYSLDASNQKVPFSKQALSANMELYAEFSSSGSAGSDKYTVTYHVNLPTGDSLDWDGITDDIKNAYDATSGLLTITQNGNILQPPPSGSNR